MKALLLLVAVVCASQAKTLKRCANLFDDSCTNGGVVGSADDEDWLSGGSNPGKRSLPQARCAVVGVMNECLDNLLESNNGNQQGSTGKRSTCKVQVMGECLDYLLESNGNQDGSVGKRSSCKVQVMGECLDYLLESNGNQDGSVGKRSSCKVQVMGECLDYLLESNGNQDGSVGKRSSCKVQVMSDCLDYMLEGNPNQEGSVGKRTAEGGGQIAEKRCANLFDDSCTNGGLVGSVDDESWLGQGSPGKRSLFRIGTQGYQRGESDSQNNAIQYLLRGMYY